MRSAIRISTYFLLAQNQTKIHRRPRDSRARVVRGWETTRLQRLPVTGIAPGQMMRSILRFVSSRIGCLYAHLGGRGYRRVLVRLHPPRILARRSSNDAHRAQRTPGGTPASDMPTRRRAPPDVPRHQGDECAVPIPFSLALIGAVGYFFLICATYRALTFVSGNSRVSAIVATLFGATYLYSCEYGIIVRQYGFGLGFALMAFAYLGDSLQTPDVRKERKGAAFAALAALTSAHPACLAGSALFAFTVAGALRRKTIKVLVPGLLAATSLSGALLDHFAERRAYAAAPQDRSFNGSFLQTVHRYLAFCDGRAWLVGHAPPFGSRNHRHHRSDRRRRRFGLGGLPPLLRLDDDALRAHCARAQFGGHQLHSFVQ